MPVVLVSYYTDPACPWSWALEPAVRMLVHDFGESVRFAYVICGMPREFGADLDRSRAVSPEHHAAGTERVELPSLDAAVRVLRPSSGGWRASG